MQRKLPEVERDDCEHPAKSASANKWGGDVNGVIANPPYVSPLQGGFDVAHHPMQFLVAPFVPLRDEEGQVRTRPNQIRPSEARREECLHDYFQRTDSQSGTRGGGVPPPNCLSGTSVRLGSLKGIDGEVT